MRLEDFASKDLRAFAATKKYLRSSIASQTLRTRTAQAAQPCAGDNGGITLAPGFCATVFADNIGHARQMVVGPNGVLYVNTWSGRYYHNDTPPAGGFLVALQDTTGAGRADVVIRFGPGRESGNAGGTGIAIYDGGLYAETNDRIVRYALPPQTAIHPGHGGTTTIQAEMLLNPFVPAS